MGSNDPRVDDLLGVLDVSLVEFEELLGELADQTERITPKLDAVARDQREIRSEVTDLREMIETLTQRVERLTTLLSDSRPR